MSDAIVFPDIIKPSYGTTIDPEDTSLLTKMDDGSQVGRRKFTKSRISWKLKWDAITKSDYLILSDFLRNTVYFSALTFKWICPLDNTTYTVRYTAKEEFETKDVNTLTGSITLTEA